MNWLLSLAAPQATVLAAVVVLLGVALTVAGTLTGGWRTRVHERTRASADRLFKERGELITEVVVAFKKGGGAVADIMDGTTATPISNAEFELLHARLLVFGRNDQLAVIFMRWFEAMLAAGAHREWFLVPESRAASAQGGPDTDASVFRMGHLHCKSLMWKAEEEFVVQARSLL